jgi:putative RecB family exonuclease
MALLSYSQIDGWLSCPERYRLERVVKVPVPPAWYLTGGKAVHVATELADLGLEMYEEFDPRDLWLSAFDAAIAETVAEDKTDTPQDQWRMSRSHGQDWWAVAGERMLNNWLDWRLESKWQPLAGEASIETYIEGAFGHHKIRGYIDRIMATPEGEPVVLDIKTGQAPKFPLQLGVYAVLLRRQGLEVDRGAYFLAETGELVDIDLSGWTEEVVSRYVLSLGEAVDSGEYLPRPGIFCSTCAVRPQCSVGSLLYLPPPKGRKNVIKPLTPKKGIEHAAAQV